MPELDIQQEPIRSPTASPRARPTRPSPAISLLRLEALSVREIGYKDHRFGIDTPYLATPLGWGEYAPLYGEDALDAPWDVVVISPAEFTVEHGALYPHDGLFPRHGFFPAVV